MLTCTRGEADGQQNQQRAAAAHASAGSHAADHGVKVSLLAMCSIRHSYEKHLASDVHLASAARIPGRPHAMLTAGEQRLGSENEGVWHWNALREGICVIKVIKVTPPMASMGSAAQMDAHVRGTACGATLRRKAAGEPRSDDETHPGARMQ